MFLYAVNDGSLKYAINETTVFSRNGVEMLVEWVHTRISRRVGFNFFPVAICAACCTLCFFTNGIASYYATHNSRDHLDIWCNQIRNETLTTTTTNYTMKGAIRYYCMRYYKTAEFTKWNQSDGSAYFLVLSLGVTPAIIVNNQQ